MQHAIVSTNRVAKPRTQASYQSASIQITWEEVTDYRNKDEDAIVIALSKVEKQLDPVEEFPILFPKTISTKLPPLRNGNHSINPKPGSEWLPMWRPSATTLVDKFMTDLMPK